MIYKFIIILILILFPQPLQAEEDCGNSFDFQSYLANNGFKYLLEYLQKDNKVKIIIQPQFNDDFMGLCGIRFEIRVDF